ncbi:MAG TPA: extracellular solute-binding protein [Acidimicrobiales bacterium]|nr:extracellular solute-binding protein [Acidimicrobiales bacterium]
MSRRNFLQFMGLGAGAIGAGGLLAACGSGGAAGGGSGSPQTAGAANGAIEKGAKLHVMRWTQFVDADRTYWEKNTKRFTQKTGVPVTVDWQAWTNIEAKAATAARVGSGPDIFLVFYDTPQLYPSKLLDLTSLATEVGKAHGGWFHTAELYGKSNGKWIALPLGANGSEWLYRKSWLEQAGFKQFPKTTDELLAAAKALKAHGHPIGLALGHAVGDANTWCYWLLYAFGGKLVDSNNKVAINSPETVKALDYAHQLYQNFIPGTVSWLDSNNNKAYLAGDISATANGISIYFSATKDHQAIAQDTGSAPYPVGPVGKPTQLNQFDQAMVMAYTKYPNAARAYLKFMWDKDQYLPWMTASKGYVSPPLNDYATVPFWTSKPIYTPYQYAVRDQFTDGYAGNLGHNSAQALANFTVVDMVARAATGRQSPKDSAAQAESELKSVYA